MRNTYKLNTAVGLLKYANIYDSVSKHLPDAVKNYRPFNLEDSLTGGLVAGGIGALGGAALGSVRNMFRPKEERKKHNDALFYGAMGGLGLGLPTALAPKLINYYIQNTSNIKNLVPEEHTFSSLLKNDYMPESIVRYFVGWNAPDLTLDYLLK